MTEAGKRLLSQVLGKRIAPGSIAAIEAEATAAAEQRLRSALEVVLNHLNRAAQDVHYDEGHQPTGWQGCSTERCREVRDDMAHARAALLDSDTPPPASPRQGEPVEGLDVDALRRAIYTVSVRHDWEHTTDREDRTQEIAAEYLAALSEPAEAGEPG